MFVTSVCPFVVSVTEVWRHLGNEEIRNLRTAAGVEIK
jgi:hypothetical protein